ncbi:MAG: hypothetical protein V4444_04595 [Pseudomonadota bacterium]
MPEFNNVADLDRWFPKRPRFQAPRGLGLLEIDGCLDERGQLIASHPQAWAVEIAEAVGAYIERNVRGTGVIVFGRCDDRRPDYQKSYRYTPIGGDPA